MKPTNLKYVLTIDLNNMVSVIDKLFFQACDGIRRNMANNSVSNVIVRFMYRLGYEKS